MYTYLLRRLLQIIPILLLMSIIVFAMAHAAPGGPFSGVEDPKISQAYLNKQAERLGLNDPIYVQYGHWLKNMVTGQFGWSLRFGIPVADMLKVRIWNTFVLASSALLIVLVASIPIGIFSARRPYSKMDYAVTSVSFLGLSTPVFFAGLVLIYFFAIRWHIFPATGTVTAGVDPTIWDRLHHLILPAVTLAIISAATYTRFMRSSMLEVMRSDYVRTAYAKGLRERSVLWKHVVRNALIPIVTLIGLDLGLLLSGAVLTETIYSWPGIGTLFLEAVLNRDYPVIMSINLIGTVCVLFGNLIADITYAFVDPRIRYE